MKSGRLVAPALALTFALAATSASPAAQLQPKDLVMSAPSMAAIWKADANGQGGYAWAQGLSIPHYGWFGNDGNFYVPDRGWVAILKITPDGTVSALATGGHLVLPVTVIPTMDDSAFVVSDMGANKILRIDYDGTQTVMHDNTTAGGLLNVPDGMAYDADGTLYVANLGDDTIIKIDPQGNATLFADDKLLISRPGGMALDGASNLFVANYGYHTITRFRTDTGVGEVFAGPDESKIISPNDLKLSRDGGLLAAGRPGKVVRIDALGEMTVVFSDSSVGELDGISVLADDTLCGGRYEMYGEGTPGSGGFTPKFRGIFSPCPGQIIGLEFLDFVGGAPAILFVGSDSLPQGALSFKGAPMLVNPAGNVFLPIILSLPGSGPGEGDLRLQFTFPDEPAFVGLSLYHQVFAGDPGAAHGVSASNGLLEYIGS
jgi:sugar lactone lactonase YvrE